MHYQGHPYRTVWHPTEAARTIRIIDQRALPWAFLVEDLREVKDVARAIRDMHVRGAGCIGITAAYGMALAAETSVPLEVAAQLLKSTRPTAVNLAWAVDHMLRVGPTWAEAERLAEEDIAMCRAIGRHGLEIFHQLADAKRTKRGLPPNTLTPDLLRKGGGHQVEQKISPTLNVLTHCNAGWLAFVDIGSATAPIYAAHDAGLPIHVWVDETRPRSQGARLTAWELASHGVPHTVIADNAGGHLMQHGLVDLVITGADRVSRMGDVANKIGTYLKALAARDCGVPFYVALPSSTLDWQCGDGLREIPIEDRGPEELTHAEGPDADGVLHTVRLVPDGSPAANPAFDVTPARLITGLITERGVCPASETGLLGLFPRSK
jgi:methylthioribose-1-phosphate isomerase